MSNKVKKQTKLLKNTMWLSVGTFSSKVITFFLVPFYTSILSTTEYSISDIISTTVSLTMPFFSLVISNAVCRFALDKKGNYHKIFSFGLFVVLLGFFPLALGSYVAFKFIPSIKSFWGYFIAIYFLSAVSNLESEFLKGMEKIKVLTFANIVQTLSFVVSNIVFLLLLGLRIEGYLLAYVVSHSVVIIMYFFLGKIYRYISNPFRINGDLQRNMIKYSIPLIPNAAMWWITNSSDRYFVALMVSVAANGILSVSYKIPSILSIFISVFHGAWELSVVEDFDNEKGKSFFCDTYKRYIQFNVLVAAFLILFSKILGRVMYSADFFGAWKYSAVLIIGYSFHALSGFIGYVFTTVKKTKDLFVSTIIGACLNIVLNFILIKAFGIIGAVVATVVSYFVTFAIRRKRAEKYIDIKINETYAIISFALLIVETIIVYFDFRFGWYLSCVIFALITAINFELIKDILNAIKKIICKILKH